VTAGPPPGYGRPPGSAPPPGHGPPPGPPAGDAPQAGPPPAAPPPEPLDPDAWHRLHPFTPLLRGGRWGVVLLFLLGQRGLREEEPLAVLGLLVVGAAVVGLLSFLSWRAMAYRLTTTELQIDSGVLTRRQRRVPLARLQSVDVVRPLFARALGLAELRLEVAGGGQTEAPLSYLSEDDAQRLRLRLLHLARGSRGEATLGTAPDGSPAPPPPETVLVAVPPGPLLWSNVLGPPVWAVVLFTVVAVVGAVIDPRALGVLLFSALPVTFGVVVGAIRRVLGEYGFTVSESVDGLRIRHGLLETRSATIPPGRVQVVRVREPLLWRPFGWVRVEVDVAGYAAGGDDQLSTSALLPVAPKDLAVALVARVLGEALPPPVVPPPARARWRAPLWFRRLRVGLDDRHLTSSFGFVTTTMDVVPMAKVQSLRWRQGPLQRKLGLASLHVDAAGRRLPGAVAWHRDADEALHLLGEIDARARRARVTVDATSRGRRDSPR
jgi:putative membrane protein